MNAIHAPFQLHIPRKIAVMVAVCVLGMGVLVILGPARIQRMKKAVMTWVSDRINNGEGYNFADFSTSVIHSAVTPAAPVSEAKRYAGTAHAVNALHVQLALDSLFAPGTELVPAYASLSEVETPVQRIAKMAASGASVAQLSAEVRANGELLQMATQARKMGMSATTIQEAAQRLQDYSSPRLSQ